MDLRYFLSLGMLFSGIFVFLLGVARFAGIHHIGYFIAMQVSKQTWAQKINKISLEFSVNTNKTNTVLLIFFCIRF